MVFWPSEEAILRPVGILGQRVIGTHHISHFGNVRALIQSVWSQGEVLTIWCLKCEVWSSIKAILGYAMVWVMEMV